MTKVIIPMTIELEADAAEVELQYRKEQRSSPMILFGEKYMIKEFKVNNAQFPDLINGIIKLVRFTENSE